MGFTAASGSDYYRITAVVITHQEADGGTRGLAVALWSDASDSRPGSKIFEFSCGTVKERQSHMQGALQGHNGF